MKAIDLITDALEEAGIKDYASSVDGDTINRCFKTLNKLIDFLSLDDVVIPYKKEIVQTVSGSSVTIGIGGTVNVTRPRDIFNTSFIRVNGVDYPLELVNQEVFNRIAIKSTAAYPAYLYYKKSLPLGELHFWPAASNTELHLAVNADLPAFADYTTDYDIAPGYKAMLTYNLAEWLCSGIRDVPVSVEKMALKTLNKLKSANITVGKLPVPSLLSKTRGLRRL